MIQNVSKYWKNYANLRFDMSIYFFPANPLIFLPNCKHTYDGCVSLYPTSREIILLIEPLLKPGARIIETTLTGDNLLTLMNQFPIGSTIIDPQGSAQLANVCRDLRLNYHGIIHNLEHMISEQDKHRQYCQKGN